MIISSFQNTNLWKIFFPLCCKESYVKSVHYIINNIVSCSVIPRYLLTISKPQPCSTTIFFIHTINLPLYIEKFN